MSKRKPSKPITPRTETSLLPSMLTAAILSAFALGGQADATPGPTPIVDGPTTLSTDVTGIAGPDGKAGSPNGVAGANGTAGSDGSGPAGASGIAGALGGPGGGGRCWW